MFINLQKKESEKENVRIEIGGRMEKFANY
jgi:hypothetical protein